VRIKSLIFTVIIVLATVSTSACRSSVPTKPSTEAPLTGIYVSSAHYWTQWLLWFTEGVTIELEKGQPGQVVPWHDVEFIEVKPGQQFFRMWFQYGGKSGPIEGCVEINEGDLLHFKYDAPFLVTSDGNLEIIDTETEEERSFQATCPEA
jgi:hypothetical protein